MTQVAPDDLNTAREGLERLLVGDPSLLRVFLSAAVTTSDKPRMGRVPDPIAHAPRPP